MLIATWVVKNSLISWKFHHHIIIAAAATTTTTTTSATTTPTIAAAATITPTPNAVATATTPVTTKAHNWPLSSHLVQNFPLCFCSAYVNRLLYLNVILPSLSWSLSNQNKEGNETSAVWQRKPVTFISNLQLVSEGHVACSHVNCFSFDLRERTN